MIIGPLLKFHGTRDILPRFPSVAFGENEGADGRRCDAVPCELIADLRMWPADSPTELAQPRVADPEVMTHLVNDRPPNLLDDLGIAVAHRADGTPVDRDPVRQGAGVERRPTRQWHSLVEPQEAGPVSYTHLRAHETRHDLVCR